MNHEDFKKALADNPNTKFKFDPNKVIYTFTCYPEVTGVVTFVAWTKGGYFLGEVEGYENKPAFKPENVEIYKEEEKAVDSEGWIEWNGSHEAPVPAGTKVDVKYYDGNIAIGIGSQDGSRVGGCDYMCSSWYRNHTDEYKASIVAYRLHVPSVASQEAITDVLESKPSIGIDLAREASTDPLITITQEVKYTVVIKGITFTFTQEEIDGLAEELLGFTTL